ncbi:SEC-C domain-containing protein [Actinocrinis puniceicyclus]|uniref:SEC-C domain-containing protein n=1 Tax=Actinocrinis puniceicyclus TaxID=977794 RepID=A0A8J7WRV7_9ACTN|nr:SEC-C metal-binding domain-containing protein [Actinocrinis puniceicyclus]MBS2964847.1 SEC-C domain-containing protein [Actinocrinis puniceicyclus]
MSQPDSDRVAHLVRLLRDGSDDALASDLLARLGLPAQLLLSRGFGPRGHVDERDRRDALAFLAALAAGDARPAVAQRHRLADAAVLDLVAHHVEAAAARVAPGAFAWSAGLDALAAAPDQPAGLRAAALLLRARVAEGGGRAESARALVTEALDLEPKLLPAVRDAAEYALCAGDWARAWRLASSISEDSIAANVLPCLEDLRRAPMVSGRPGRNQPCPCGSGRKYKGCCEAKDAAAAEHPLSDRAVALYAMIATYAQRGARSEVHDRLLAHALGEVGAASMCLDLAILDGGAAERFLAERGFLLRDDERELLGRWLSTPMDLYEVTWTRPGFRVRLRSLVGGPQEVELDDRLLSSSVGRLDLLAARFLWDGTRARALGAAAWVNREDRREAQKLFSDGPVRPDAAALVAGGFAPRILELIVGDRTGPIELVNLDQEEYRLCNTVLALPDVYESWIALIEDCEPVPDPPLRDLNGYLAFHERMPDRFLWFDGEHIELVGKLENGSFHNLGTLEFDGLAGVVKVTTNSESRMAVLIELVRERVAEAKELRRTVQSVEELTGPRVTERTLSESARTIRRRHGVEAAAPEPRRLVFENYFLPLGPDQPALSAHISRGTLTRNLIDSASVDGLTPRQALAAGGASRDEVLAMIDDVAWRRRRAEYEGGSAAAMVDPDELRQALGLTAQ